jgi:hypothetical protein
MSDLTTASAHRTEEHPPRTADPERVTEPAASGTIGLVRSANLAVLVVVPVFAAACTSRSETAAENQAVPPTTVAAASATTAHDASTKGATPPWQGPALDPSIPHGDGGPCPAMSFADYGAGAGATSRRLGEAGVAWDKPGSPWAEPRWLPERVVGPKRVWHFRQPGRSSATGHVGLLHALVGRQRGGYGYEGETDPQNDPNPLGTRKWLAQLYVEGHDCFFNIWSHLGRQHLERLLASLRFVNEA